jgi:hypothetical protein
MRAAEMLAEHGTIERQPLLEGRSMYIVMAPLEKRPEKKIEGVETETIGDAVAAKAPQPTAPQGAAEQGS